MGADIILAILAALADMILTIGFLQILQVMV